MNYQSLAELLNDPRVVAELAKLVSRVEIQNALAQGISFPWAAYIPILVGTLTLAGTVWTVWNTRSIHQSSIKASEHLESVRTELSRQLQTELRRIESRKEFYRDRLKILEECFRICCDLQDWVLGQLNYLSSLTLGLAESLQEQRDPTPRLEFLVKVHFAHLSQEVEALSQAQVDLFKLQIETVRTAKERLEKGTSHSIDVSQLKEPAKRVMALEYEFRGRLVDEARSIRAEMEANDVAG